MIRIIIADDHPIVRAGLRQILSESGEMEVAAEVDSGEKILQEIGRGDYDVALLDITMAGMGGIEALKRIKALKPQLPVLMLSIHAEDQFAVRCLKAGAAGYLTKAGAPAELIKAIRLVVVGRKYISTELAERLAMELDQDLRRLPHERLSDREIEVLRRIARGMRVTDIAVALNLSVKTVSTYRTRILEKMGISTSAEIIVYAIKNNLC
jgi:DNA-binding NarL/FixJ family response regulator